MKMEMAGICGTDKHTYKGETTQYGENSTPFPIIPGHENVGTIAEVYPKGYDLRDFDRNPLRVGDRIVMCPDVFCGQCYYCRRGAGFVLCDYVQGYGNSFTCEDPPHLMGGWAEYIYLRPDVHIYKVPEGLPIRIAAMAELMAVTGNLDKAKEFYSFANEGFASGDTVVVQGAGPMGVLHVLKARIMGAGTIIALDASPYRLALAREFGADIAINVSETTEEERYQRVRDETDGRGADLVVECVGYPQVLREGLEMLRKGGMYIETGNFVDTGDVSINVHRHLCAKNVRLIGLTNHPVTGFPPSLKLLHRYMDTFPLHKFVSHTYSIERADEAMQKAFSEECMKVAIVP
jgi:L-iditol 2-dehydrogenase